MSEISINLIKEAVYNLCLKANTCLDDDVYKKILNAYKLSNKDERLKYILKNAKTAYEKKRPLCQDTGQVIVFVEIGQDVKISGEYLNDGINSAVEKCYIDNFFRKSVVKDALQDRTNTLTNTPAIIHTKIIKGDEVKISVLIKGAGSENKTCLKMLLPTINKEELVNECADMILSAGENACPPMFVGIGIGASADEALLMSKEALISDDDNFIADEIKARVNEKSDKKYCGSYVLDVKVKTSQTHIACMPVGITINCHSQRISRCTIAKGEIKYFHKTPEYIDFKDEQESKREVFSSNISEIKNLKQGEKILLTGEIYVARDMAHKRMAENGSPIDIKDKIIFYAGPCPKKDGDVIGSIGPTTASRMDIYAIELYNKGLLATIGKGNRSYEVEQTIKNNGARYFSVIGGIAAYLADKVKEAEIIAYKDLGPEALLKIYVEKLPVFVSI